MGLAKTYDKVSWHFPEGKGCSNLEDAKAHFAKIMQWLNDNGLLSTEGREVFSVGIGPDFALSSHLVTAEGRKLLDKCYSRWVITVEYGKQPSMSILDKCLRSIRGLQD